LGGLTNKVLCAVSPPQGVEVTESTEYSAEHRARDESIGLNRGRCTQQSDIDGETKGHIRSMCFLQFDYHYLDRLVPGIYV
jgi:hypothetical protein